MERSIDFANSKNYLDELFAVYPMSRNPARDIDDEDWLDIKRAFKNQDNETLISELLEQELFPIKDSYVAFLKRDKGAIKRNPKTVQRICGKLYEMGLGKLYEKCSSPKETNRQLGPLFKHWVGKKALGIMPCNINVFAATNDDAILDATDAEMKQWAKETVGYERNKGLDFVARFNGKYVIGEAKFLTDFGGHQNAQLVDALDTLHSPTKDNVIKVAILDGVVWLKGGNKMYATITKEYANENIMSALVLSDFLYSL